MTTYNTGNPIGSTDPRDLYDNAENLDEMVNSESKQSHPDRLGVSRKTWHGMEKEFDARQAQRVADFDSSQSARAAEFDAAQSDREGVFNAYLVSAGYQFAGDYAAGIEITQYNQLVRDENGEFWRVSGQVDLPYVTTGAGIPEGDALVPAGDAVLRQELANPDKGAAMVAFEESNVAEKLGDSLRGMPRHSNSAGYTPWEPPVLESCNPSDPGFIFDAAKQQYVEIFSELWDPLMDVDPGYIRKETLGPDSSGNHLFDVHRYIFEPANYEKTMILTSNMHGGEKIGMLALWFLMREVVNNWRDSPQLGYLRKNIRFVIIPVVNPTGYWNASRQNANGVDINRNFDYKWDEYPTGQPWDTDYKGPSPFSEVETQYVRDTLIEFSDATTYLDIHNFSSLGTGGHYPYYVSGETPSGADVVDKVIAALLTGNETVNAGKTYNPGGFNYAVKEFGMYSLNPEFDGGYYGNLFGSEVMTAACRWYSNLIMAFAHEPVQGARVDRVSPFVEFHWWRGIDQIQVQAGPDFVEIPQFRRVQLARSSGYVKVWGTVTVDGTEAAQVGVCPLVGAPNMGKFGSSASTNYFDIGVRAAEQTSLATISSPSDRVTIPFMAVFPVINGAPGGEFRIGLSAKTSAGVINISRYRAMVEFTPSGRGDDRVTYWQTFGSYPLQQHVPAP